MKGKRSYSVTDMTVVVHGVVVHLISSPSSQTFCPLPKLGFFWCHFRNRYHELAHKALSKT